MKTKRKQKAKKDDAPALATTRKEKRKEERQMKKKQKHFFSQHKKVPSIGQLREEVVEKKAKIEKVQRRQEKKKRQRQKLRERKREEREEKEAEEEKVKTAIEEEEREIKKCEKLLYLNKRKAKGLPGSFKDGLDYILQAVDRGSVATNIYDSDAEEEGDAEKKADILNSDSEEEFPSDMGTDEEDDDEFGDEFDEMDDGSEDMEEGMDEEDEDKDEDEETKKRKLISSIMQGVEELDGPAKKKVRFLEEAMENVKKQKGKKVEEEDDDDDDDGNVKKGKRKRVDDEDDDSDEDDMSDDDDDMDEMDFEDMDEEDNDAVEGEDEEESEEEEEDQDGGKFEEDEDEEQLENGNEESEEEGDDSEDFGEGDEESEEEGDEDSEDFGEGDEDEQEETTEEAPEKEEVKEDIYGRPIQKDGSKVEMYVPRAKRLAMAANDDSAKRKLQLEALQKMMKRIFNKLSEAKMQPLSAEVEALFSSHSRADTTEALTAAILAGCVRPHAIPERLVSDHAMMLAILHANVGTEVGAMFLQTLVEKLDKLCQEGYDETKEMDNILVLLSMLYNFKIVRAGLMFDVMKRFAERFREKDVELILLILRNVGFGLRKDDAAGLKDFIVDIQSRASAMDFSQAEDKARVRFMLETIAHIRNNNVRKIPNYDPTHMEHLRKLLRNFTKGGSGGMELNVSLEDLLSADQRGKWWLVGSAWQGRQLTPTLMTGKQEEEAISEVPGVSAQIVRLAKKQRMNTDVRRNIFYVVMSAEDDAEAFQGLLGLGLNKKSQQEIIHVIVHCCLAEKAYNHYYTQLLEKFCEYDRRFQMTLQFNLWDKFKELPSYEQSPKAYEREKISRLASMLAYLIACKAMSLSIFKVIEFVDIDKGRVKLLRMVLTSLLLDHDADTVTKPVFSRIATLTGLGMLRENLKIVMRHYILRPATKGKGAVVGEERVKLLKERIEMAEQALMVNSTNWV